MGVSWVREQFTSMGVGGDGIGRGIKIVYIYAFLSLVSIIILDKHN